MHDVAAIDDDGLAEHEGRQVRQQADRSAREVVWPMPVAAPVMTTVRS